jgi:hypothetical protein
MIEKYKIVRDKEKDLLTIREFAILEKIYKAGDFPAYTEEDFSLRCEQDYKSGEIEEAVVSGKTAVISALRTHNMYPVSHQADAIADSIIELYGSEEKLSTELLFDDQETFGNTR